MSWFKRTPKKASPPQEGVQVSDYPKELYSAYWEKLPHQDHHNKTQQGVGVVRFYDRKSGKLLSYSTVEGSDWESIEAKLDALIVTTMSNYEV